MQRKNCREIMIYAAHRSSLEKWAKNVSKCFYMQRLDSWNEKFCYSEMSLIFFNKKEASRSVLLLVKETNSSTPFISLLFLPSLVLFLIFVIFSELE